jgi:ACS family glucarate transporter-like MFS transporter
LTATVLRLFGTHVTPATQVATPTRTRYWVIVFAVTLAILSYIDRVAISQAAGAITRDLGLNKSRMGLVFGAFALSYSLFEIPSGWLGDAIGPRRVLVRIVLAWSAFTALTGAAWNFGSLWTVRFLFGAGEAGCFPNLTKAFSVWLPRSERARSQGIMWAFARWGGAFTPPLVVFTFRYVSWRVAFVLFGTLGLIWCWVFYRWFRDRPSEHPSVNAAELQLIGEGAALAAGHGDVPWRKLIGCRSLWLLWAQYFCLSFGWYFYITWLPTYLQEFRHQSAAAAASLAVLPLLFGGFGSLTSGLVAARVARWLGNASRGRRAIAIAGMCGAAGLTLLVTQIESALMAMVAMGLASYANDLVMPPAWHSCMDIGGRYAGTVAGSMNMMGNLAGFVAPVIGGFLLDRTHGDWNLLLYMMAGVYVAGALCWPFVDPVTPLESNQV